MFLVLTPTYECFNKFVASSTLYMKFALVLTEAVRARIKTSFSCVPDFLKLPLSMMLVWCVLND